MQSPPQDNYITIDGVKVRTRASPSLGKDYSKPVVLLFHGFSFTSDVWTQTGIDQVLTENGFSYLAIDLPKGKATRSDRFSKKNFSDYVPFLKKVVAHFVDLEKSRLVLLGASMGGGFALSYALENKDKISGLVLVAPSLTGIDEDSLSELDAPALLVWGERDNIFPVAEYGKRLKETLPSAKLLIIKGAGHAAYLDRPQEFHDLLADFLDEIS
jgi:abhydrolase domain-containing protein 14